MGNDISFDATLVCALECKDLDAAIAWYKEKLGCELIYRVDHMGWCEMTSPIKDVAIGLSAVEQPTTRGGATLTFGVRDLDSARSFLEGGGVKFDGDTIEIPELVRLAGFFDPDGNKFMLSQGLGAHAPA